MKSIGEDRPSEGINSQFSLSVQRRSPLLILKGGGDQWWPQRGSTVNVEAVTSVDPVGDWQSPQRGSTVNFHFCVQRRLPLLILEGGIDNCLRGGIDDQLREGSTVNVEAITSVDPGGINNCLREWSTVNRSQRQLPLLILGGELTIASEGINSQLRLWGISWCIMGNLLSSTTELQTNSICTCYVKSGIYCDLHVKVKVDCWSSLWQSLIPPPLTGSTVLITSMLIASTLTVDCLCVDRRSRSLCPQTLRAKHGLATRTVHDWINLQMSKNGFWGSVLRFRSAKRF